MLREGGASSNHRPTRWLLDRPPEFIIIGSAFRPDPLAGDDEGDTYNPNIAFAMMFF
jgi:hypothetical protein